MNGPAGVPVEQVPVGEPGPWTVYRHYLGGDDILIQAPERAAGRFVTRVLGIDLAEECRCDWGCGPLWAQHEGPSDDGSFPSRPVSVQDEQGPRWNGTPRTQIYLRAQVTACVLC